MKKQEILVIIYAVVAVLIGVLIEIIWGNCTNTIARSGAVLVCIGIFFGVSDISVTNLLKQDKNLSLLKEELQGLEQKRDEIDIVFSDEELRSKIRGSTAYLTERAIVIYKQKNTKPVTVDLIVVLSGTLIWGFGDLVFGFFTVCT